MEESAAATTTTTTTTTILPATPLHRAIFQSPPNQNQNQNQNGITTPTESLLNLDTVSLKSSSYTSLKDVLPFTATAVVNSPTTSSHEISIRNRLVKQAAWAYLQPMSASPTGPSGPHLLRHRFSSVSHRHRHRHRSRNPLTTCLSFICHHLIPCFTGTFHRIVHAIRGPVPILCFWLL